MVFTGLSCRRWAHWDGVEQAKRVALSAVFFAAVLAMPMVVGAKGPSSTAPVALTSLPVEAQGTYSAIRSGGPFQYSKDGIVFGNRERLLPRKARGFYREYTVKTPGSRDRGARRIVCGGPVPVEPEACYYTDDHYASFRLIAQ